ncbi:MAG: 50S ribosomal protein L9 [Candidatus Omnitrophota bacterium]
MQVILKKDIDKLGKTGAVVAVENGYARNFLLPKGFALPASPVNVKIVEAEKKKIALREEKEKREAQQLAEKIGALSCTIAVQAGNEGKLFGSVTNQDVVLALQNEGIEVDKKKIDLPEPIKELGVFKVEIKLHPEVVASVKIWVVKK